MPEITALPTLPHSPLVQELATRLGTRLADMKGSFGHIFTPTTATPAPLAGHLYDALLLPGTLSLTPNPAATLQNLLPYVRPEGVILGWVLGEGSLPELTTACQKSGFTPPPALPAVQDVGSLLQTLKLALPVVDKDPLTVTFSNPTKMLQNLKQHNGLLRPPHSGLVTPRRWQALLHSLPQRPDGKHSCTLSIIFFHAVIPGQGLPQAAKRGSGKVSMVKILAPI